MKLQTLVFVLNIIALVRSECTSDQCISDFVKQYMSDVAKLPVEISYESPVKNSNKSHLDIGVNDKNLTEIEDSVSEKVKNQSEIVVNNKSDRDYGSFAYDPKTPSLNMSEIKDNVSEIIEEESKVDIGNKSDIDSGVHVPNPSKRFFNMHAIGKPVPKMEEFVGDIVNKESKIVLSDVIGSKLDRQVQNPNLPLTDINDIRKSLPKVQNYFSDIIKEESAAILNHARNFKNPANNDVSGNILSTLNVNVPDIIRQEADGGINYNIDDLNKREDSDMNIMNRAFVSISLPKSDDNINNTLQNHSKSVSNETDLDGLIKNINVSALNISNIDKNLHKIIGEISEVVKDELKNIYEVKHDTDIHKNIENKTTIHLRSFSLNELVKNTTQVPKFNILDIQVPETLKANNITEINNGLASVLTNLGKTLLQELEHLIERVIEDETLDWVHKELDDDTSTTATTSTTTSTPITTKTFTTTSTPITKTTSITTPTPITTTPALTTTTPSTTITNPTKIEDRTIERASKELGDDTSITTKPSIKTSPTVTTKLPDTIVTMLKTTKITSDSSSTLSAFTTTNSVPISTTTKEYITTDSTASSVILTTTTPKPAPSNAVFTSTEYATEKVDNVTIETTKPDDKKAAERSKIFNVNLFDDNDNEIKDDYYDIPDDNSTDYPIIDYIELYKDTTNEYVRPTDLPVISAIDINTDLENVIENETVNTLNNGTHTEPSPLFPWVAAIFLKNGSSSQFDYYCDGVLLSNTVVLTAARCLNRPKQVNVSDVIVFLGKRTLAGVEDGETIHRVSQITTHPKFTVQEGGARNDLAALLLETPAVFNEGIGAACLAEEDGAVAATTTWEPSLSVIKFVAVNKTCDRNTADNVFCSTYGNDVAPCPSYGGVYASKANDTWCVRGIRTDDPSVRGYCLDKTVTYTDLKKYRHWIQAVLQ